MALLLRVLAQYKSNDIESAVKTLSSEEQDVLLKFIYKGFSEPSDSACGCLLYTSPSPRDKRQSRMPSSA